MANHSLYPWQLLEKVQKCFLNAEDQQNSDLIRRPSFTRSPSFSVSNTDGGHRSSPPKENRKLHSKGKEKMTNFKKSIEMQNQDKYLRERFGLFRFLIIPDGNCLYRAMAQALTHDQSTYKILRHQTICHIEENIDDFKALIEGNPREFVKEAAKDGTWASYTEILVMTQLYNINIMIITGGNASNSEVHSTLHHYAPGGGVITPKDTVWLSWLSNGHYDLILDSELLNPQYDQWMVEKNSTLERDELFAQSLAFNEEQPHHRGITERVKNYFSGANHRDHSGTPVDRPVSDQCSTQSWSLAEDERMAKRLQEEEDRGDAEMAKRLQEEEEQRLFAEHYRNDYA